MAKQIQYGDDARKAVYAGVQIVNDAVKVTMWPKGRNVILERSFGSPTVTNDGVTVAKEIDLEDKYENIGASLAKEAASKTNDAAGDGTTTATILAQSIFVTGLKNVTAGANPMDLKRGIDTAVAAVIDSLKKQSKEVEKYGEEEVRMRELYVKCINEGYDAGYCLEKYPAAF